MVTHPSINQVRLRIITLIKTNVLPLSQAMRSGIIEYHTNNGTGNKCDDLAELQNQDCAVFDVPSNTV